MRDDMTERRHFPRLHANTLWRPAGFLTPRSPVADMSLGGARVYSDELVAVDDRLEIELMVPGKASLELLARVVRVHVLPPGALALYDVALEFLVMTNEARCQLAGLLGVTPFPVQDEGSVSGPTHGCASQPRVDEHDCKHVDDVEHEHGEERLLQPSARVSFASGPQGDRHVCEQNRDKNELLHRPGW
jgi:PilZ domain